MKRKMNEWILTDDDCCQYVKQNNPTEFSLIQLSRCNGRLPEEYEVFEDTIDVRDYFDTMAGELENILRTFDYQDVTDVREKYGQTANQIMAECVFEHYGSFQANRLMKGTREDAEYTIRAFIGAEHKADGDTVQRVFSIIEDALTKAGYKVLDGDRNMVFVRLSQTDTDFEIKITEVAP